MPRNELPPAPHPAEVRQPRPGAAWFAAVLALHAAWLGGATEGWSRGVALILVGLAAAVRPPLCSLGRWANAALLLLAAWSIVPLLPERWLTRSDPAWKAALADYMTLPPTLSPQPWLTAEAALLMAGGLLAFYWFATLRLPEETRRETVRLYTSGMVLLACVCLVFLALRYEPRIWRNAWHFGPFPSRNHTGNLLGVGAVLAAVCALEDFRRRRRRAWWFLGGTVVLIAALVQSLSRGGMLAFVAGMAFYLGWMGLRQRSPRMVGLSLAGLIAGAVLLGLFAGRFSERLASLRLEDAGSVLGFRGLVYLDALRLAAANPLPGLGLANFEAVFPFFRSASVGPYRLIHPESDWWWAAAELGWVGCGILLAVIATLVPRCAEAFRERNRALERGALAAVVGFALHGLIDVPAHLFGTALPALLLLGVVLGAGNLQPVQPWVRWLFRLLGVAVAAGGAYLLAADQLARSPWPGSSGAARALEKSRAAAQAGRHEQATALASRGLAYAPLSWRLHFQHALALLPLGGFEEAQRGFQCAKLLQPARAELPELEGQAWLPFAPALAASAWREALALDPAHAPQRLERMLAQARENQPLRTALRDSARRKPELFIVYLGHCPRAEAIAEIDEWRKRDPELASFEPKPLEQLLALWWAHDQPRVAEGLRANPRWLATGWPLLAKQLAAEKAFEQACRLALAQLPAPRYPEIPKAGKEELRRRVVLNPADFISAFALARLHKQEGDLSEAAFIVGRTAAQPAAPAYLWYLKAELAAKTGDWTAAWAALARYAGL
jgi:O-antigen ligase